MHQTEVIQFRVPGKPVACSVRNVGIIRAVDRSLPHRGITSLAPGAEALFDHHVAAGVVAGGSDVLSALRDVDFGIVCNFVLPAKLCAT